MAGIFKVFLLLAVMVCISYAQHNESGQQCLCQRVRSGLRPTTKVKEIQIYQATIFCDRVEIVVTDQSGRRFCLNPKLKAIQKLLSNMMAKQNPSTTTSVPASTSAAHI